MAHSARRIFLVASLLLILSTCSGTTAAFLQEEHHFKRSSDVDIIVKRAFNMGKKFGGYSWLRSADSRRRRLEYYLSSKWQRDENLRRLPFLTNSWNGGNN